MGGGAQRRERKAQGCRLAAAWAVAQGTWLHA